MKSKALPTFVAVDGEGRNVAGIGSEHLYTLLASSAGAGVYEEETRLGLSTSRCFELLLWLERTQPSSTFVGFSINYDANMWLRDLPKLAIKDLWQRGRCYWQDHALRRAYKVQYVPSKWFDLTWYEYPSQNKRTIQHIRIWDVWGFFQCSFVKALRQWFPEKKEIIEHIENMKEQRGEFTDAMQSEVREYCLIECRLLVELMNKLAQALWDAGLPLTQWHGAGAIASRMLRQHKIKEHLVWDMLPDAVQDASLWGYFGGRVEIFQQGIIPGPVYDYDIQSAYPERIMLLPSLRDGEWMLFDGADFHDVWVEDSRMIRYGLVHVSWDTRQHRDAWLAPFPQHFEGGRVAWEPVGEGWYHYDEWRAAKEIFGSCIHEQEAWLFYPADDTLMPFGFIQGVYAQKAAYKTAGDPRYYPLKVGLNSLYGKLAQSMTRNAAWGQPPYQNYFLAGMVTAGTRARILRALAECGQRYAVMVATDGLFTRKHMPRLRLGAAIGNWELVMANDGMTLVQAGVFWEPGNEHAKRRTRGFGVKSVSYADACLLFSPPYRDHEYNETRFIGMGYCVSTGDWTNWRRWVEVRRKLSADLAPHHIVSNNTTNSIVSPLAHRMVYQGVLHDPAKRRPYLTRAERMVTPDNEQLEAIVASEQPQGTGG